MKLQIILLPFSRIKSLTYDMWLAILVTWHGLGISSDSTLYYE